MQFNDRSNISMRFFSKSFLLPIAFVLGAFFLIQGCDDSTNALTITYNPPPAFDLSTADSSYTTNDGLQLFIFKKGNGLFEVIPRDQVSVKYTGRKIENGKVGEVFDSTFRNERTTGVLRNLQSVPPPDGSASTLIEGFRRAIIGMKEGGKRTVIIPPSLGYGDTREGQSGYNLRNDTLRFDIELVEIL
jgi:FKBP-type peptidyl-prolyl cis-trans isomerase FkpA